MKLFTHYLDTRELRNASSDDAWSGVTLCGVPCGAEHKTRLTHYGQKAQCSECRRERKKRDATSLIGKREVDF